MPDSLVIISGGQTGADRAALDWAIKNGVPHAGWCPKGRRALDGPLDLKYNLRETPSAEWLERTEWNVRDSDATVVFTMAEKPSGGSKKTITFAKKYEKPYLHLHPGVLAGPSKLRSFIEENRARRLNLAGSRAEKEPQLYAWVLLMLDKSLVIVKKPEEDQEQQIQAVNG